MNSISNKLLWRINNTLESKFGEPDQKSNQIKVFKHHKMYTAFYNTKNDRVKICVRATVDLIKSFISINIAVCVEETDDKGFFFYLGDRSDFKLPENLSICSASKDEFFNDDLIGFTKELCTKL